MIVFMVESFGLKLMKMWVSEKKCGIGSGGVY